MQGKRLGLVFFALGAFLVHVHTTLSFLWALVGIPLAYHLLPTEKQEEVVSENKEKQEGVTPNHLLEMYRTFINEVHRRGNLSVNSSQKSPCRL